MIQKIFIILVIMIIIPDIYLYYSFIKKLTQKSYIRFLYFIPSLLALSVLLYIAFLASGNFLSANSQYIGWMAIGYMLMVFPKIIFSLFSLLDLSLKYLIPKSFRPFKYIGLLVALFSIGLIIYGASVGKTLFTVKNIPIYSSHIPPAFENYRIVQLSDIHIGSWKGNRESLKKAVEIVNNQNADLVVFTGDLVNNKTDELDGFEEILASIKGKDGVFSILGNHDYGTYYHWDSPDELTANLEELKIRERKMGWEMLNNEHHILYKGDDSIALIGVENHGEPPFSQHGDLKKAMKGVEAPFKILLSHNPTHWKREVLSTDIDLMLAGHTHAMQMSWGNHSLASYVYPQWGGLYTEGNQFLYVNIGLGFIGIPLRIGAYPEITVFTLHSK